MARQTSEVEGIIMKRISLMIQTNVISFIKREGEWNENFNPNKKLWCNDVTLEPYQKVLLARDSKYFYYLKNYNSVTFGNECRGFQIYNKLYSWDS